MPISRSKKSRPLLAALSILSPIICLLLPNLVRAVAGDLDLTFGIGGKVAVPLIHGVGVSQAMALQSDGKIILGGEFLGTINRRDFYMIRCNSDGAIDSTFGSGGEVITDFYEIDEVITSLLVQPDGKIIAAGFTFFEGNDFAIARYHPDGSLDASFGSGGKVRTNFFGNNDFISSIALQSDGKLIAAGEAAIMPNIPRLAIARFNSDGSLDSTFGAGGKIVGDAREAKDIAIQADGKIIAISSVDSGFPTLLDVYVTRFNKDGSLDSTFGISGSTLIDVSSNDIATSVIVQSNGKIIVAGLGNVGLPVLSDIIVIGLNPDGSLDPSFGSGGKVITDILGGSDSAQDVVLQADKKIIVGGETFNSSRGGGDFVLVRYNENGSIDSSFGTAGIIITDFAIESDEAVHTLVLQANGKLVAAGRGTGFIYVSRYLIELPYDLCIQDDGSGNRLQVSTATGEYQFSTCSGFTLGGVGVLTKKGSTITLQHNAPDRRVTVKADLGVRKATVLVQTFAPARLFAFTDKNTANNTCSCER